MKEATGELNLTVIIVIMIAVLVSFFFFTFWPLIQQNMNQTSSCSKAICPCKKEDSKKNGVCSDCYLVDDKGNRINDDDLTCVWKG